MMNTNRSDENPPPGEQPILDPQLSHEIRLSFDALIAGIEASRSLATRCEAALRAAGPEAGTYLRTVATQAAPERRTLLLTVAERIGDQQDLAPNAAKKILGALVALAIMRNDRLSAAVVPALLTMGVAAIETLVCNAISYIDSPATCLRVLRVIEQFENIHEFKVPPWILDHLQTSKSPAVRKLADKLFMAMSPASEDDIDIFS
jgi:hypothetical protein